MFVQSSTWIWGAAYRVKHKVVESRKFNVSAIWLVHFAKFTLLWNPGHRWMPTVRTAKHLLPESTAKSVESGTNDVICQFCTVKGMVVESEVLKAQNCALSKFSLPVHCNVLTFWLQNDSKSTQVGQKRRCWNFSTPLESFWSNFEANFDYSGHFEVFFSYKLNLSRIKSSPKQRVYPCVRHFNTLVHEVYRYFDQNWTKIVKIGKFSKFCLSMPFPDNFRLKNFIYHFSNFTGQHIFSLLTFSTFQSTKFVENLEKKCINSLEIEKFRDFCHFRCQFETFSFRIISS